MSSITHTLFFIQQGNTCFFSIMRNIFGNKDESTEIALMFLEIKKDIAGISHKVNTVQNNVTDLYDAVYKSDDSIQVRLKSVEGDVAALKDRDDSKNTLLSSVLIAFIAFTIPTVWNAIANQSTPAPPATEKTH